MICPICGHDNLPGIEACGNCTQDLTPLDRPSPHSKVERSLMEDVVGALRFSAALTVPPTRPAALVDGECKYRIGERSTTCLSNGQWPWRRLPSRQLPNWISSRPRQPSDYRGAIGSKEGLLAQGSGLATPRADGQDLNGGLHHRARAKRVVQLFMSGAASQVDTFDYKPLLERRHGQPFDPGGRVELFQSSPGSCMKSPCWCST